MNNIYDDYRHANCSCGGHIGSFDRGLTFKCERCNTEYSLQILDYEMFYFNQKTGWVFPMISKKRGDVDVKRNC